MGENWGGDDRQHFNLLNVWWAKVYYQVDFLKLESFRLWETLDINKYVQVFERDNLAILIDGISNVTFFIIHEKNLDYVSCNYKSMPK